MAMVIINFIMILVYNFLTPYMSDDLWYDIGVMKSLPELISGSVNSYMTWGGRSIADFILRTSFCFPKSVFNVLNSLMFAALSLLIYLNIEGRRRTDAQVYLYVILFMWLFIVSFDQTILWVSGACNYLWTGVIIMSFVTLYRVKAAGLTLVSDEATEPVGATAGAGAAALPTAMSKSRAILSCIGVFFLGLAAGWCNENTSGGALLLAIIFVLTGSGVIAPKTDKGVSGSTSDPIGSRIGALIRSMPWTLAGMIGCVIGIILMISAPGVRVRAAERIADEEHSGMFAYIGRFLKLNDAVVRNLAVLIVIITVLAVYHILKGRSIFSLRYVFIYTAIAIITVYALMATVIPMDRALFGAGIFLIIAAIQAIAYIPREDIYMTTLKIAVPIILGLYLAVTYISCGADLFRITRELNERQEYVDERKAAGDLDLTLPGLRPEWNNRYTYIYNNGNDVDEEDDSYGNSIYKEYYGLKDVHGIDRTEWTEY